MHFKGHYEYLEILPLDFKTYVELWMLFDSCLQISVNLHMEHE